MTEDTDLLREIRDIMLEIRDLKRKQILGERVTSVVTSPAASPSADAEHTHCDCHVGACHVCGEKSMESLDKPYFCERCQIRTYKPHIHTEIP